MSQQIQSDSDYSFSAEMLSILVYSVSMNGYKMRESKCN